MNILKSLVTGNSKKLMVFIVASLLVIFKDYFDLNSEQIQALEILTGGYLVSQGIADVNKSATKLKIDAGIEVKKEKS